MLRVVFEAPTGAGGSALGDVRVSGRQLTFGGQLAEKLQIRLTGIARHAANPAPRLTCQGAGVAGPLILGGEPAMRSPSRLSEPQFALSPE